MGDAVGQLHDLAAAFRGAFQELFILGHLPVDFLAACDVAGVGKPGDLGMLLLHFLQLSEAGLTVGDASQQLFDAIPWLHRKAFAS